MEETARPSGFAPFPFGGEARRKSDGAGEDEVVVEIVAYQEGAGAYLLEAVFAVEGEGAVVLGVDAEQKGGSFRLRGQRLWTDLKAACRHRSYGSGKRRRCASTRCRWERGRASGRSGVVRME